MSYTAHLDRLATFAQHGQPKDYGGSDMMRADLESLLKSLTGAQPAPAAPSKEDYRDTLQAVFNAVGYTEEYARQWPKEKASVTFKRWFDEKLAAPAAQPADSAMEVNAKRYEFLRDRLLAADFDWNESGQCVLVFKWPENVAVSADCDDNIDRALAAFDALENN
jgi:hypothetical protein